MAENSPPPSEDQQSRGRPLNPGKSQTIERVDVTRLDVQTGEIKELHTDLLEEVCECINEQTETLGKKFDQAKREIVRALERQRKSGGSATGGGGGGAGKKNKEEAELSKARKIAATSVTKLAQEMGVTSAEAKKLKKEMKGLVDSTKDAASALDVIGSVAVLFRGVEQLWNDFQSDLELAKTGLVDLTDTFTDLGAGLREERFTTAQSFQAMRDAIERGAMPAIGTIGATLQEVGHELFTFQDRITQFGFRFGESMDFQEMSAATVQLLDLEKRSSVQASLRDSRTTRSIASQLTLLQDISLFTGKTVDALLKDNQQTLLDIENLVATGAMSKEEGDLYQAILTHLGPDSPLGQVVIEAANKGGIQMAAATNPLIQQLLAQNHPVAGLLYDLEGNTKAMHEQLEKDPTAFLMEEVNKRMQEGNIVLTKGLLFGLESSKELAAIAGQTRIVAATDIEAAKMAREREKAEDPTRTALARYAQEGQRQFRANIPDKILAYTKDIVTILGGVYGLLKTGLSFLGIAGAGVGAVSGVGAGAAATGVGTGAVLGGTAATLAAGGGIAAGVGKLAYDTATKPTDELGSYFSRVSPVTAPQMAIMDFMARQARGEGIGDSLGGAFKGALAPISMGLIDQPEDDPFKGKEKSLWHIATGTGPETVSPASSFEMSAARETEKIMSSLASGQFDQTDLMQEAVGYLKSLDSSNAEVAGAMKAMSGGDPSQIAVMLQNQLAQRGVNVSRADAADIFSSMISVGQ